MSLAIDTNKVEAVLLPDGEWYSVKLWDDGRRSFVIDAYEFLDGHYPDGTPVHLGGDSGVSSGGAEFEIGQKQIATTKSGKPSSRITLIACPLSSVLAVRYTQDKDVR